MQYLIALLMIGALNTMIYLSSYLQFSHLVSRQTAFYVCLALAIPAQLMAFFVARASFDIAGGAYGARFMLFAVGWVTFPLLTQIVLGEPFFRPKVLVSLAISIVLMLIQFYWRDAPAV